MNLKEILKKGIQVLKEANIEAPAIDAGVILCHVTGFDRSFIYTHGENVPERSKEAQFFRLIKERASGKPLQYITGHQEFMSLDFNVNSSVLIPRQDTEILVEAVIEFAKKTEAAKLNVLDMGTGSGCIAISIAHYIKGCYVTAVDISAEALKLARENAARVGVQDRVTFLQSDLFQGFSLSCKNNNLFDIIVSNPPYITSDEMSKLDRQVKDFEPILALSGGEDGLTYYKKIISESGKFLNSGGLLAFEVGYNQAAQVSHLMEEGFSDINVIKDLSGTNRVVTGKAIIK